MTDSKPNKHFENNGCDGCDDSNTCLYENSMQNSALHQRSTAKACTTGCSLKIEWLNSLEAAEYLRLPVKTLLNKTSNGEIPFTKLGRLNRYRKDELEAMLLSKKRGNQYGNKV